jgi:hypothetical protein
MRPDTLLIFVCYMPHPPELGTTFIVVSFTDDRLEALCSGRFFVLMLQ